MFFLNVSYSALFSQIKWLMIYPFNVTLSLMHLKKLLMSFMFEGCGEQVGRRMNEGEEGYVKGGYRIGAMSQPAFLHSSSVLKKRGPAWVVYQEVFETDKVYLRCVTEIQPDWLARFLPGLCNLGKALDVPPPRYCTQTGRVRATFKGKITPSELSLN